MNILDKKEIVTMGEGSLVEGYAYIMSYAKQPTKTGSSYIDGAMQVKGDMKFKVWSNGVCFNEMLSNDFSNTICKINAKVNIYGGAYSLILNTIEVVSDDEVNLKPSDLFLAKYDAESYYTSLVNTLKKNVSEKAMQVFDLVMTDDIKSNFMEEFAAVYHHDNCKSGLLAHTTKVVKLATLSKLYPKILERVSADLLYIGAALHDIGKIVEYSTGMISENGRILAHSSWGMLLLEEKHKEIAELMSEEYYYRLLSIVAQHNGEGYGEAPRTVASYVINQFDCLDSVLTTLSQALESAEAGSQIVMDGLKLS